MASALLRTKCTLKSCAVVIGVSNIAAEWALKVWDYVKRCEAIEGQLGRP